MIRLSLCMIVKNEEDVLARCLNSIKSTVDEIVIVDTGSTDNTINIAKKFTDQIYHFDWCDDFASARNFAFSKAHGDYIMWLDADDVVPHSTATAINKLKDNLTADVVMLKYNCAFDNGKPTFSFYRERIIKNCNQAQWIGYVHECIIPFGKIEYIESAIEHRKIHTSNPNRNLKIYRKILATRQLSPRENYYYARELFDHKFYRSSIKQFKKFINSKNGWIENVIDAYFMIGNAYYILGQYNNAIKYLLQSLEYTSPRANICCVIGDCYLQLNDIYLSKKWYILATKCDMDTKNSAFTTSTYFNYYPYLRLCYCSYKEGNLLEAIEYNNKASKYNPSGAEVIYNNNYFNSLIKNKNA